MQPLDTNYNTTLNSVKDKELVAPQDRDQKRGRGHLEQPQVICIVAKRGDIVGGCLYFLKSIFINIYALFVGFIAGLPA